MLTYQVRPRVLRFDAENVPTFPGEGKVNFYLQPLQPFGAAADGGKTAVRAVKARALFNANTGSHTIESEDPLSPLEIRIEEPDRQVELNGSVLTVSQEFESPEEMLALIEAVAYVLPSLINVSFYDPPYVERVDGVLGGSKFRWELREWKMQFGITTQSIQERHVVNAWQRIDVLSEVKRRRRLTASLHYFHVACRLSRASVTVGEFMAETVLNFSKSLEALFPPEGDGMTRDAVRNGLRALGYEDEQIEMKFVPAMALRDNIDVAHVGLCIFNLNQLRVIHRYVEQAETAFRDLFERLFTAIENDEYQIEPHEMSKPSREVAEVIERIQSSIASSSDEA